MGDEFVQWQESDHDAELDWLAFQSPNHQHVRQLVADLNSLYRELPALHRYDFESRGFRWIDCHDSDQSVISYVRHGDGERSIPVVVLNLTPVPREDVPVGGPYRETLNTDSRCYGGSDFGNRGMIEGLADGEMGLSAALSLRLPPLAGVVLVPEA